MCKDAKEAPNFGEKRSFCKADLENSCDMFVYVGDEFERMKCLLGSVCESESIYKGMKTAKWTT
jgi:hypothetical protein